MICEVCCDVHEWESNGIRDGPFHCPLSLSGRCPLQSRRRESDDYFF